MSYILNHKCDELNLNEIEYSNSPYKEKTGYLLDWIPQDVELLRHNMSGRTLDHANPLV